MIMIIIVSDSHVPNRAPEIPAGVVESMEEADRVVHAGDFDSEETFSQLDEQFEDMIAVKGNCDFFDLPNSETFEEGELRIGVYHGTGITPRGDHDTLLDIARNKLEVDVLIHGHTHQQEVFQDGTTLLVNPGSCTGVGGGSSRRGNPKMIEMGVERNNVRVRKVEFEEGEEKVEEEEFEV